AHQPIRPLSVQRIVSADSCFAAYACVRGTLGFRGQTTTVFLHPDGYARRVRKIKLQQTETRRPASPFLQRAGALKPPKMLLAAMILAVTGNVRAHDWYPKECCGGSHLLLSSVQGSKRR